MTRQLNHSNPHLYSAVRRSLRERLRSILYVELLSQADSLNIRFVILSTLARTPSTFVSVLAKNRLKAMLNRCASAFYRFLFSPNINKFLVHAVNICDIHRTFCGVYALYSPET